MSKYTDLIAIIESDQASSAQRWDMAIKTDDSDRGFRADAAECDAAYDEALEALHEDDLEAAESALERANMCESRGGDNCDAHHSLRAVRAAMSHD